ncbi:MAG TPA: aldehyde dehydrogenase family protein [Acidimicrobiales bacterium]|nr:aldehyde dehydrogenase family protein [Acidimicrobiales bacterium]
MTAGKDATLTINGMAVAGDEGSYPVHNPARPAEVVLHAPITSVYQVDQAVGGAVRAAPGWAAVPFDERRRLVVAAAEAAMAAVESDPDLPAFLTRENGKVLAESQFELATISGVAQGFGDLAAEALVPRQVAGGGKVTFEPVGVVAALLPFNWPVSVLVSKLAPALLAGNAVVVKPPPTCPGTALVVAQAFARALPPGVVSTVNGPGASVGETVVAHPGISMVSLTGGVRTGRAVMEMASRRLIPVLLELGGNDAAIIAPDVEPSEALAEQLLQAALLTSGQVCMAIKRLYVPESRLAAMVEALVGRMAATVTGDGLDAETTLGPVHTAQAAVFASRLLADASAAGVRVHRPGQIRELDVRAGGYFVPPAIIEAPDRRAAIVTDEQFAPLLPVLAYRDLDDAIAAANDSQYGLGASVWSGDEELGEQVASQLQAGTVFRNAHGPGALDPRLSFGGWNDSGIGQEYGIEGVLAYTRQRSTLPFRALS